MLPWTCSLARPTQDSFGKMSTYHSELISRVRFGFELPLPAAADANEAAILSAFCKWIGFDTELLRKDSVTGRKSTSVLWTKLWNWIKGRRNGEASGGEERALHPFRHRPRLTLHHSAEESTRPAEAIITSPPHHLTTSPTMLVLKVIYDFMDL
nr:hypothetical protein CFP56_79615 [Quercus suber]